MAAALRVAFFGDSWMGEWHHGTVVPTPIAVSARTVLQERLQHGFEMTVVAFPGCTAMHALCLAEYCSVQDMAYWSSRGWSIRSTIAMYEEGGWPVDDEVDLIVVMLGSNDLEKEHEPLVVAPRPTEFQKLYAQRGKEVAFVTVGGAGPEHVEMWPGYEEDRVETNRLLKAIPYRPTLRSSIWTISSPVFIASSGSMAGTSIAWATPRSVAAWARH